MESTGKHLQDIVDQLIDNKRIFGSITCISNGGEDWSAASGNLTEQQPFFIGSVTKLFITTVILQLRSIHKIKLSDPIAYFIPSEYLKGLHKYKGKDGAKYLTVKHLLAQTSGLPDYFSQRPPSGSSLKQQLIKGNDQKWSFEEAIERAKKMPAKFKIGQKNKAYYSDTNFQLLGRLIEVIHKRPIAEVFKTSIFDVLDLQSTYLFQNNGTNAIPAKMYFKNQPLDIPEAMASFGPDGGIVSTAQELMTFLKAFFQGGLFPVENIEEIQQWNKIFFPLQYGIGITKFQLPWYMSPFQSAPVLIGHSGLSGAFAYYCPAKDAYLTGTVNQINHPDISFKLMLKLLGLLEGSTTKKKVSQQAYLIMKNYPTLLNVFLNGVLDYSVFIASVVILATVPSKRLVT